MSEQWTPQEMQAIHEGAVRAARTVEATFVSASDCVQVDVSALAALGEYLATHDIAELVDWNGLTAYRQSLRARPYKQPMGMIFPDGESHTDAIIGLKSGRMDKRMIHDVAAGLHDPYADADDPML